MSRGLPQNELRLEPAELAELMGWTEQPDFLNARAELGVKFVIVAKVKVKLSSLTPELLTSIKEDVLYEFVVSKA